MLGGGCTLSEIGIRRRSASSEHGPGAMKFVSGGDKSNSASERHLFDETLGLYSRHCYEYGT
jgi:hypothetical protein